MIAGRALPVKPPPAQPKMFCAATPTKRRCLRSSLVSPVPKKSRPALDLRGIELPNLVSVARIDLSGSRFDFARMNWNFGGSILRGAVFNGAEGRNVDFGGCDLHSSFFIKARLPGAVFYGANLQDADLSGIGMRGGQLKDAVCRNAKFTGSDLRMVWAADADLRGADLREANLVGASLGGVLWDSKTRLDGAQLSVEGTPADLRTHALAQGASVRSEKPEWQLNLIDATLRALESETHDAGSKRIMERLRAIRPEVERDPGFLWANALRPEIDGEHWTIFQRAVRKPSVTWARCLSEMEL